MANDYSIIDETIVEENRKLYEIIVAEKQSNPFLIRPRRQRELKQRKTVLALAKASGEHIEKQAKLQQDQQLIEEVLANGCER